MPRPIITLTTDFGISSPYVAQMKGIIFGINPEANVVDVTHDIPPQDIAAGALVLRDVHDAFPPGTIHIAVVDPGVGTKRRIILATIGAQQYLVPDNGLLSELLDQPPAAIAATNPEYWRATLAATFHGRDIFAPIAAHLSLGLDPSKIGPRADEIVWLPRRRPTIAPSKITGEITASDSFGNLITNITSRNLASANIATDRAEIRIAGRTIVGIVKTYGSAPAQSLIALFGSGGYLEIAVAGGNATTLLRAARGEAIEISAPLA